MRVLWSHDALEQTRGYWAIGVALHRAGCEVVLGGPQTPGEVAEAPARSRSTWWATAPWATARRRACARCRRSSPRSARPGVPPPPLAAAGIFDPEESLALRAAGVREVFEILTPVDEIAARLRALGAESAAVRNG